MFTTVIPLYPLGCLRTYPCTW